MQISDNFHRLCAISLNGNAVMQCWHALFKLHQTLQILIT